MRLLRTTLLLAVIALPVQGATLYVSKAGDGSDGISWETAFQTISSALIASSTGDDIWVKGATYEETLALRSGVRIFGGFDGSEKAGEFDDRNWRQNRTIVETHESEELAIDPVDLIGSTLDGLEIRFVKRNHTAIRVSGESATLTLKNCIVIDDNPMRRGETIVILGGGVLKLENSLVLRSSAETEGGFIGLGSNDGLPGHCFASNCTFWMSSFAFDSQLYPLAIFVLGGSTSDPPPVVHVENCIAAPERRGIRIAALAPFTIGIFTATYSCLVGNPSTRPGNISADPLFVDPENGDYRLRPNSPCIDSGTTVELFNDLDGNPRPKDVPGIGVDGEDAFDMGAYEFQTSFRNSRTDINRDGYVNSLDLLIFQNDWGKVSGM